MKTNKYSDLKIVHFPEKIRSFQEGRITAPIYVRFKPINKCNHGCVFCTYSDGTLRPKDRKDQHIQSGMHKDMDESSTVETAKALEILDDLKEMGTRAITFSGGGEPLLHKNITSLMQRAIDNGIDLSIITNGQLLNGERAEVLSFAKWVRVSIDYTDAEGMNASRNVPLASFEAVMQSLRNFAKIKKSCDLGVNYIVTRYNYKNLVPFARKLKDAGVENIRFSPVYVQGFKEYHQPIAEEVEMQLRECQSFCDENFTINSTYDLNSPTKGNERPFKKCFYAQTVPVIGADLGVYACKDHAYSRAGKIGSLHDKSFKEMWFSAETKKWFDNFNPSVSCVNMECAAHMKILLYEQLVNSHMDNFV